VVVLTRDDHLKLGENWADPFWYSVRGDIFGAKGEDDEVTIKLGVIPGWMCCKKGADPMNTQ